AAAILGQIRKFILPAVEPRALAGLALRLGHGGQGVLVGLHQVELLALHIQDLAEKIGSQARRRTRKLSGGQSVRSDVKLHGCLGKVGGKPPSLYQEGCAAKKENPETAGFPDLVRSPRRGQDGPARAAGSQRISQQG